MSDTRFIILGIALVFAGFLVLGILGRPFLEFTVQVTALIIQKMVLFLLIVHQ